MSHCLLLDGSIVQLVLFDHDHWQCIDLPKPQKGTDKLEVASCYRGISVGFTSPIPTESHVRLAQATINGVSLTPGRIAEVCANHIKFRRDFGKWRQSRRSNFEIPVDPSNINPVACPDHTSLQRTILRPHLPATPVKAHKSFLSVTKYLSSVAHWGFVRNHRR